MANLALANYYSTILAVAEVEKTFKLPQVGLGLTSDYQPSLKEVLGHEGGFTDESTDPGGPTNWGITIIDARMYWKPSATREDVKAMPLAVAKDIYKSKYWDKVRGDELPAGVDYCVFDYGVNSGVGRAIPLLQKLVGVTPDGKLGPETMAAVAKACSTQEGRDAIINAYQNARLAFLQGLHHWPTYGRGWGTRVREVRALALKMSAATLPPIQQPAKPVQPPATIPSPGKGPIRSLPPAGTPQPPSGLFSIIAVILKAVFGKK